MPRHGSARSGKGWPKPPGSFVYHGASVREVLADGVTTRVRRDLGPDSPASRWRPKYAKKAKKSRRAAKLPAERILFSTMKKGALHRDMHFPTGRKIPLAELRRYKSACQREILIAGTERARKLWRTKLARVQLAINMRGFRHGKVK